jgi:hypothetical protein
VVLYEVHAVSRHLATVPVPAPRDAQQRVRDAVSPDQEGIEERARRFLAANPDMAAWIRALAAVLAVAAVLAAIILIVDPVPGDEIPVAALAAALFRVAMAR